MAVLSISRQFGAGGITLSSKVAKKLGYQFVEESILHEIAQQANVSPEWVESVEKEAGGRLMRIVASLVPSSFIERHVGDASGDFDEKKYVEFLSRIICEIADKDNAVILGRGSQFILADHPDTLKVRIVSARPDRIQFMMDHYDMTLEKAERTVTREENKHCRFFKNFYSGDINDPNLYHMVLNTSLLSIEEAEYLIIKLVNKFVDARSKPIWD